MEHRYGEHLQSGDVRDTGDAVFLDTYCGEVSHRGREHARTRLAGAVRRAAMIRDGLPIVRTGKVAPLPVAELEIDCDAEWGTDGRVYLWGARLRRAGDDAAAVFVPFADWTVRDADAERALAERFVGWLRGIRDLARLAGWRVRVYHWSPAETARLRRILGEQVTDLLDPHTGLFTDLEGLFNANFLSVHGSSIKVVAPAFGFTWSATDAGGAASQAHLDVVRAGGAAEAGEARDWLLTYNRDDTAAMAAIRDGMNLWP